ncbi:MAG: HD domain-containing protein [bacterium]|nr:HD domain-containing protein [bacterium]
MAEKKNPKGNGVSSQQKLRVGSGGEEGGKGHVKLRPISLSNLPWGIDAPVDLYQRLGQDLSLLFRRGQDLAPEAYREISSNTQKLYYDSQSLVNWQTLVDNNLTSILKTPLATEAKAAVAYGSAARTTQKMFSEFDEEGYETAGGTVEAMNELMNEPAAMESFFQLTIHDYYTYTHSLHVYIYATMLTRSIIGSENTAMLKDLGVGYLLHDIGKKDISTDILNKPGKLTDTEFDLIKKHPEDGYRFLTEIAGSLSEEVTQIVLQHHEKCNGKGYPKGLTDLEIGRYGRICGIADVYDALTTRRSYKEALSKMTAFTIMQDSDGHFDSKMLDRFIRLAVQYIE